MITAVEGTNFYKGLAHVRPLIGNTLYWASMSGTVPDSEGMYAVNLPLPPSGELFGRRINCAGATNLFLPAATMLKNVRLLLETLKDLAKASFCCH